MYNFGNHSKKEQNLLKKICQNINEGSFSEVLTIISEKNRNAAHDQETAIHNAIRESTQMWDDHITSIQNLEPYSASEFLFTEWSRFQKSAVRPKLPDQFFYSLKTFVFTRILKGYLELYNLSGIEDAEILTKVGIVYKELGNYEQAIQSFELAHKQQKSDPGILLLLADCYAQVDEMRAAKLFFREALFIDPEICKEIKCEAAFITSIFDKMREEKIEESLLYFWLPVYAVLLGLFTVKRELKPVEIGKLKQAIYKLEQQVPVEKYHPDRALLFNKYFWLLDHYESIQAQKSLTDDILLKIKNIDSSIYEQYVH